MDRCGESLVTRPTRCPHAHGRLNLSAGTFLHCCSWGEIARLGAPWDFHVHQWAGKQERPGPGDWEAHSGVGIGEVEGLADVHRMHIAPYQLHHAP